MDQRRLLMLDESSLALAPIIVAQLCKLITDIRDQSVTSSSSNRMWATCCVIAIEDTRCRGPRRDGRYEQ